MEQELLEMLGVVARHLVDKIGALPVDWRMGPGSIRIDLIPGGGEIVVPQHAVHGQRRKPANPDSQWEQVPDADCAAKPVQCVSRFVELQDFGKTPENSLDGGPVARARALLLQLAFARGFP